jgi:hypothetical protein
VHMQGMFYLPLRIPFSPSLDLRSGAAGRAGETNVS